MTRSPRYSLLATPGFLTLSLLVACSGGSEGDEPASDSPSGGSDSTLAGSTTSTSAAGTASSTGGQPSTSAVSQTTASAATGAMSSATGADATTASSTSSSMASTSSGGASLAASSTTGEPVTSTSGQPVTSTSGGTTSTSGGTTSTSGAGGGSGSEYPCDGDTSGYDAVVSIEGSSNAQSVIQAAVDGLTPGRTSKESVLVQGAGSMSAGSRVSLPSYTVLNVCGSIDVTGSGSGDMAPVYARDRTDIEVPNLTLTGAPLYGMFFRNVNNIHLGNIEMRLSGGLGIRVDNHGGDRAVKSTNLRIDRVYIEGATNQGVETYCIDGIDIGTVIVRNVGYSGLLLNDSINAEIGVVDAEGVGADTGYAAFRTANRNGRVGNEYPTNIHVGEVIARGGGRGIFCVSESGGVQIDRIDIADAGNNSILLENCYNVTIAAIEGSVSGGGDVRIAARDEFANSSDITIQNLTVTNSAINESPCADNSNFLDNTLVNSSQNTCD